MSKLQLRIYDGSRQLFTAPADFLVTVFDGNQTRVVYKDFTTSVINFDDLPYFGNFGDLYSVNVVASGYKSAGFAPVKLSDQYMTTLDVMLVRNDPGFSFVNARWDAVSRQFPFLGSDTSPVLAQTRYENILDRQEEVLACFLNLFEAMGQINLAQGTPLDYIKQVRWDEAPARDRFFAYCDRALVDQIRAAAAKGLFSQEGAAAIFHPGATASWKQVQFGEANVQLTFHENESDQKVINGVNCVTVEPDIDYYRDLSAHAIVEVIPNRLTHTLTNPIEVYVLRWMAGRHAGIPDFTPLYTLT